MGNDEKNEICASQEIPQSRLWSAVSLYSDKSVTWKGALISPLWYPDLRLPPFRTLSSAFLLSRSSWPVVFCCSSLKGLGQGLKVLEIDCTTM